MPRRVGCTGRDVHGVGFIIIRSTREEQTVYPSVSSKSRTEEKGEEELAIGAQAGGDTGAGDGPHESEEITLPPTIYF